jgi:hypothetical protein
VSCVTAGGKILVLLYITSYAVVLLSLKVPTYITYVGANNVTINYNHEFHTYSSTRTRCINIAMHVIIPLVKVDSEVVISSSSVVVVVWLRMSGREHA